MNQQISFLYNHVTKLEQIEKELLKLKKGESIGIIKKPISLKGILKGLKISLKDIEMAKKSLFKQNGS